MPSDTSWHEPAAGDLIAGELSLQEIGEKYGRSVSSVKKLMYSRNIKRKNLNRRGPKSLADKAPLSPLHQTLGMRLSYLAANYGDRFVGRKLRASTVTLRYMTNGMHDFKLSELVTLADLLGMPLGSIFDSVTKTGLDGRRRREDLPGEGRRE